MKKRIAVVGYGGQGGWHADHARNSDVVELGGIYDILPARCELAGSRGIHAYPSFEAVLADEAVEIVVVATPNDVHKDLVIRALQAGKNVVCEKPVALSVADFDEMTAAAAKAHRLFSVHQNRRWDVDFLAMRGILESGEIGEAIRVESRIHGSRGIPSDWRCQKQYGGGMILDWGVHLIDQMLLLLPGTVTAVSCTETHITNKEVDDGFRLELGFADGASAYVEVGTYNFIALPRFYLQAQKGSAIITDWRQNAQVVRCKAWKESDVVPVQTAAGITKTMAPRDSVTVDAYEKERPTSDVHDFYRNLCAAIDGREEQAVKACEVRRVLRVMEAAMASDAMGQSLKVEI